MPGYVHEVELMLVDRADVQGPGSAVTAALGGAWPHHTAITRRGGGYLLRTVFVAPESEEALVRERIVSGLGEANEWEVVTTASRTLTHEEELLADRLAQVRP